MRRLFGPFGRNPAPGARGGLGRRLKWEQSEPSAVLARAIDPQHEHVTGGLVAASVGVDAIQRPIAAIAWQRSHSSMRGNRIAAGVFAQPLDRSPNRCQTVPRPWA